MERSKFTDGVEIGAEALEYTELTKIQAIRRLVTVLGTTGPSQGLYTAPDPNVPTKVLMSAGSGWTYGGEYVTFDSDQAGITVSNLVGVETYVAVKVIENDAVQLPHIVTGVMYGTKVVHTYSVVTYTKAAWDALTASDKDMHMLAAVVTGSGGIVRGMDIRHPFSSLVTLLYVERQPVALTGCVVKVVSTNTQVGAGYLKFDYSLKTLEWKEPGGSGYGLPVDIGVSGQYTLYDFLGINFIKVYVDVTALPTEDVTEALTVINLLEQFDLNLGTMKDSLHRGLLGSGTASPTNPHGMTLDDLDPGDEQDIFKHRLKSHAPGIIGTPSSSSGAVSIYTATQIKISAILPGESVLSGGKSYEALSDVYVTFSGTSGTYYIYVGEGGIVQFDVVAPGEDYLQLATVSWSGTTLSNLVDKRKWGSISLTNLVHNDDDSISLDPATATRTYSGADSLALIRGAIKNVTGEVTWKTVPTNTLIALYDYIVTLQGNVSTLTSSIAAVAADLTTHGNLSVESGEDTAHGIFGGQGGKIDADLLRGLSPADLPVGGARKIVTSEADGYLSPDWLLGRQVPVFAAMETTPFYGQVGNVQASGGDPYCELGFTMSLVFNQQTFYMPASRNACGCTVTCGCTGTCGCTCTGTCGCTGTGGGNGGCHFWG